MTSKFKPAWWLKNRHLQSCYATAFPPYKTLDFNKKTLELPDGDFIEIAYLGCQHAPCVILLPGLEGSIQSANTQIITKTILDMNWQIVVMQYRSCHGQINRLAKSYNSLDYTDFSYLLDTLKNKNPNIPFYAVGVSMGGNILLHYLKQKTSLLQAGITISTPFDMAATVKYMPQFYHQVFCKTLKKKAIQKVKQGIKFPATLSQINSIRTLEDYDRIITAPLYGFSSASDYYNKASCFSFLSEITLPTLMIHALDDPFIPKDTVPKKETLSTEIELLICKHGGHTGFITGKTPGRPTYWYAQKLRQHLFETL